MKLVVKNETHFMYNILL